MSIRSTVVQNLPSPLLTSVRTARWTLARVRSEALAHLPSELDHGRSVVPPTFIIGSGRSGTTVLGDVLARCPELSYFFEPVDRWFAVSESTDYGGVFNPRAGRCLLDGTLVDDQLRTRFRRVFRTALVDGGRMLEKTPINAFRIGFLDAIDPRTRYIEIRRDGADVVRSILQLSRRNDYNLLGRGESNRWWGQGDCKWRSLARDLVDFELEPEYLVPEAEFATRAAIEWISSLKAVERQAQRLGDRLLRVDYSDLIQDAESTVERIAGFLGVKQGPWIRSAANELSFPTRRYVLPLVLPGPIARRFNRWNERIGCSGRAIEGPHISGFTADGFTTSGAA
jgi:hypothetical protein